VLSGVTALLLGGCITPSIPIPPPEPQAMRFMVNATDGLATFRYQAAERFADAVVYVFNRDQGTGIIATAGPDGSVGPTQPFPAEAGDQVLITFEIGDEASSQCVLVEEGIPSQVCF
jgi:hypothetical protein